MPCPVVNWRKKKGRSVGIMTAHEAIQELLKIQQYCTPRSLAAVDYAIRAIQEKEAREKAEKE